MSITIAKGMSIAALILLLIYGADEAVSGDGESGFLPLSAMVRGLALGGSAIALSIASFFVARETSTFIWIILIVNGILVMMGGIAASSAVVTGLGILVIALGIIKRFRDSKIAKMM